MSNEFLQDYPFSIPAGGQLRLPAGNFFFLYELTGVTSIKAQFYQGRQASAKAAIYSGFKWGDGYPAKDGRALFDSVILYNEGAATATGICYTSWRKVEASRFSGDVDINSLPIGDTRQNPIFTAQGFPDPAKQTEWIAGFEGTSNSTWRYGLSIFRPSGLAATKRLIVQELRGWCGGEGFVYLDCSLSTTTRGTDGYWSANNPRIMKPQATTTTTEVEGYISSNVSSATGGSVWGSDLQEISGTNGVAASGEVVFGCNIEIDDSTYGTTLVVENRSGAAQPVVLMARGVIVDVS